MIVDTDYPATNDITVLIARQADALASATPVRVRVPGWSVRASAWVNGDRVAVTNGTMMEATCPPHLALCTVSLSLTPRVRLETWFGDSVSVLRGPLVGGHP